ncbi:zinc finger protein 211-like [Branchiostoma floridae]|uniref:Zinc finger protein 211-like n=1 Tax=Branchiostoma floridae TaxID=7739 RepID=A0A9J7N780_BRAFL|nr:zinc finger protein 211-like [Branchiostoma floridae]
MDFVYGRDFHDHLASHNKEKKHVCTVCGNSYARRSSLLQHRRLHDPDGHKCYIFEKFFPKDARLKEHQVIHSGETQHVCDVCQKKFKYKRGLITHMRQLHPQGDERPAKCTVCSKEFKCEQYLKRHMCRSIFAEQLKYAQSERADIVTMEKAGYKDVNLTDVIRFFTGDNPAQWVEMGEQHQGTYGCSAGCGAPIDRFTGLGPASWGIVSA